MRGKFKTFHGVKFTKLVDIILFKRNTSPMTCRILVQEYIWNSNILLDLLRNSYIYLHSD